MTQREDIARIFELHDLLVGNAGILARVNSSTLFDAPLAELALLLKRAPLAQLAGASNQSITFDWEYRGKVPSLNLGWTRSRSDGWAVPALVTLDRNGFVRQAALQLIEDDPSGESLPFVLLRCSDWVPQVAAKARTAFAACLQKSTDEQVLAVLSGALLRTKKRADEDAQEKLLKRVELMPDKALLGAMQRGLASRWLFHELIRRRSPLLSEAIRNGLASKLSVLRIDAARAIPHAPTGDEQMLLAIALDANGPVRSAALHSVPREGLTRAQLEKAVVDDFADVRAFGRAELARRDPEFSARRVYLEMIAASGSAERAIALAGLSECQQPEDAAESVLLVDDASRSIRMAALRSLVKLSPADAGAAALAALQDTSGKVLRLAVAICAAHPPPHLATGVDGLLDARSGGSLDQLRRKSALRLVGNLEPDQRVKALLRIVDDPQLERKALNRIEKVLAHHQAIPVARGLLEQLQRGVSALQVAETEVRHRWRHKNEAEMRAEQKRRLLWMLSLALNPTNASPS